MKMALDLVTALAHCAHLQSVFIYVNEALKQRALMISSLDKK